MKDTIEFTYIKEHTVELNDNAQNYIAEAIYDAFTRELCDYVDDGDADHLPSDTLKEIFIHITKDMVKDEEFWED